MTDLWLDLDTVRAEWPDALVDDESLTALVLAAQVQIEAYAPASLLDLIPTTLPATELDPLPPSLRQALVMQVRDIWRATERETEVLGITDAYPVRAPDMTIAVRKLLRPHRALKVPH